MENNNFEKLTKLQATLSDQYQPGELSTVAILGLIGEAGEVLGETYVSMINGRMGGVVGQTVKCCQIVDNLKKSIRKNPGIGKITIEPDNKPAFISELADCLYYLNILTTNMGLEISDLAKMAYDKIINKQQTGGSSEDQTNKTI